MSSPDLTAAERQAVADVLLTSNLSMGQQIQAFENAFCTLTGSKHAIAVNSGTAGLHLCVHAVGIQENDLVITTPFSFVASANALLFERAIPVFVDIDPRTGNIDPEQVRQAAKDLSAGGAAARRWRMARRRAAWPVEGYPAGGCVWTASRFRSHPGNCSPLPIGCDRRFL
jgi:hypothetical protein